MHGVKAGGDRQVLHEAIRSHSMAAARRVKEEGASNDLLERIASDPLFDSVKSELHSLVNPLRFVGRAPEQVDEYISEEVQPILEENISQASQSLSDEVNV